MFRFEALVHDVEPVTRDGRHTGARIEVDVIRGSLGPGERVIFFGPGRCEIAGATVDELAVCEFDEWDDSQGRRPVDGSRLLLVVNDVPLSQVWRRSRVQSVALAGGPSPILCPWAATFDLLSSPEEGIALADLLAWGPPPDDRMLANGEAIDYFLGCWYGERALASVLAERMRALFGGDEGSAIDEWSYLRLWYCTRDRYGHRDSTPEERAALAARLADHGIELSYAQRWN
jgi:hypothetical protein